MIMSHLKSHLFSDLFYNEDDIFKFKAKQKARCRFCSQLNYDHISGCYRPDWEPFCGVHGMARVDPDGFQLNLDHRGGCDFHPKFRSTQLTFDFDDVL